MIKRAVAIVLLAALAVSCKAPPASPDYFSGQFNVGGTATNANIYYKVFDGAATNVLYNVNLPWSHSFEGVQSGDDYFLAAQSNDSTATTLTVQVVVTDAALDDSQSTPVEPFGYVAVYGTVP
jgi:hypothetical protein